MPIADRELRVNARKRGTFRVRVAAGLVALVIGTGFFALASTRTFGGWNLGGTLFSVLTWLCLAGSLSAGLFFTADCLSEEKREGTLGFLFLTDLRGYDVVVGKLLAASLRAFYALLAVFPVVAVTFLMGGVTGLAFWKSLLALVNVLFVSIAAGLFVSTLSRDSQKALVATLMLLAFWVAAGPVCDSIWASIYKRPFNPVLSITSPGFLFHIAGAPGRTPYWWSLLVNQILAGIFFALSCALVSRTWQDKAKSNAPLFQRRWNWRVSRRRLGESNPVVWLASRERWQLIVLWVIVLLTIAGAAIIFQSGSGTGWIIWGFVGGFFTLVLYLAVASQSGRFFVEARRTGLLELLLATPLSARQIVQGHWQACVRMFGLPLILFLAASAVGTFMAQEQTAKTLAAMPVPGPPPVPGATNTPAATSTTVIRTGNRMTVTVGGTVVGPKRWVTATVALIQSLTRITDFAALLWFGMWMGLTSNKGSLATLKTIAFIQIIPWFVISIFVSGLMVPIFMLPALSIGSTQMMVWYPLLTGLISAVLYIAKDIFFCLWARKKLYTQFRERTAGLVPAQRSFVPTPLKAV